MTARSRVLGVVLAGGMSRRMGGRDKGLVELAGRSLLARVVERVRPQVDVLIASVNGDGHRYEALGLPIVSDTLRGPDGTPAGPLAGILSALDWAAMGGSDADKPGFAWVVSIPVDLPFVPPDLVERLTATGAQSDARVVCAASSGRLHPVVAAWSVLCRTDLRRALEVEGRRKVGDVTAALDRVVVDWPVGTCDPFTNINTPADLERARRNAVDDT